MHRQYLSSPAWAAKRKEALAYYGPVCSRCGGYGTDVHHRTYARVGGCEKMRDLGIMCRGCDQAHHAAERCSGRRKRVRSPLDRAAAFRILTFRQKKHLKIQFALTDGELFVGLTEGLDTKLSREVERIIGRKLSDRITVIRIVKPNEEYERIERQRAHYSAIIISHGVRPEWADKSTLGQLRRVAKYIEEGRPIFQIVGKRGLQAASERRNET